MSEDAPEVWKDVVGYEGRYSVSDLGRVWSHYVGRVLRPYPNRLPVGYLMVSLYRDGKRVPRTLHSLVLEAFVGPCPDGQECLHGPEISFLNNRLRNLRYGTRQRNVQDAVDAGRNVRGARSHFSRLTEGQIPAIRADLRPLKEVAADYNVHFATISCVRLGRTWKHV